MRSWLIGLALIVGLAGCADNTAGIRIDGQTQQIFLTTMCWAVDYW